MTQTIKSNDDFFELKNDDDHLVFGKPKKRIHLPKLEEALKKAKVPEIKHAPTRLHR